jgi:glutamyl-tRNA(Gln) amidotransferase subunit D
MSYSSHVSDILEGLGVNEGDRLDVVSDGRTYTGVLMPHHEFSDPDVIVLKLKSGYNIGLRVTEDTRIGLREKSSASNGVKRVPEPMEGMKELAILGTGGTIASYVDYRTGAVHPALSTEDLVNAVPEIAEVANIRAEVLFSIFSENMSVENWQAIAAAVADRLADGAEGCLVPHGTDTMGYTSAALSFMLEDLPRPVVLVGAQRSSDRPSSDAYTNLLSAARFAVNGDAAEAFVMMHDSPSDSSFAVHRGTRVRKMHTSRRDAFKSLNSPPLAVMDVHGNVEYNLPYHRKHEGRPRLRMEMDDDVTLLYFYPGMSATKFENLMLSHKGVVIAGTGLGHVSREMISVIRKATSSGVKVFMTSQCLFGSVNLNVYDTGRDILSAGALPLGDMLPETAYVKLMWALGQSKDDGEVDRLMLTDLRGEMGDRREIV